MEQNYLASDLQVLEGLDAVRKRPGMYIGTTDSRGLMHCIWEIIDNCVDEALAGFCSRIEIVLHKDKTVEVIDNGRGIPVDVEPKTGMSGVEVVMTKLHAGGKFGNSAYAASGGLHGVGASVVNALSEHLEVQVKRGGKIYQMQFTRGKVTQELTVVGKTAAKETGTTIRYLADGQIFLQTAQFSYDDLETRARQTAFLVPGLKITITDLREDVYGQVFADVEEHPKVQEFLYTGGLVDFVDFLSTDEPLTDIWHITGADYFSETVQMLDEKTQVMRAQEVRRECKVDVALRFGAGYETNVKSFVNIIATTGGGSHLSGFETALLRVIRKEIEANARKLKITAKELQDLKIEKDDIMAGLTAVITVRFPEPQFEGQTKEILGTSSVRPIVQKVLMEEFSKILQSTKREYKAQAVVVLEKVVSEMHARISARKQKDITRRKNALETSSLPPKLADCRSKDVEKSELFIVEGDSALGTAKLARNSDFQALLPIRGKILNVQKASISAMLSNKECASIIQVVGAGSGRSFDIENARYSKVIIMTDADVDGAHIRTLLLTLFWCYMRPMIEAGRVFAAVPPLHRIELSARSSSSEEKYIYTYSDDDLAHKLRELNSEKKRYKDDIQRYKGLGEMDADQLAETTMNPQQRLLRRIKLGDAETAVSRTIKTFELLMGDDVPPRKEFIINSVTKFDRSKIDA
ncbi:MAG: type IIA DNA topoisomerase subunit B [Candidatus Ancillula trichonymphae]|jgi:DNA gyrase subunit B|nr:type IIA DNA topoisomerase subunit B [Candidatus Ancillula trichonymphae]